MDKVFVIKQFLKDTGVKFRDYSDAIIIDEPNKDFDTYICFFRPIIGTVPSDAAEDEIYLQIEIVHSSEEEAEGAIDHRAYIKISLADPDCFFKIGEAIKYGLRAPLKWTIERLQIP